MQQKQAVWLVVQPPNMPQPPASGDLNSHPELSAWRSSVHSKMQVFMFRCVRAVTFEVTKHVSEAGHRTPSIYPVWTS